MATTPNTTNTGMELHDLLLDREFLDRKNVPDRAEKRFEALQVLARVFAETPQAVLQKLVDITVEFCGQTVRELALKIPRQRNFAGLPFPEASRSM
jgi:hypothetical protein